MLAKFMATRMFCIKFIPHFFDGAGRVGILSHTLKAVIQDGQVFVAKVFKPYVLCACASGTDEFVEFNLDSFAIAILGILDEKNHEKSNDRGARIDDKLPCIRKVKKWTRNTPDKYCGNGQ